MTTALLLAREATPTRRETARYLSQAGYRGRGRGGVTVIKQSSTATPISSFCWIMSSRIERPGHLPTDQKAVGGAGVPALRHVPEAQELPASRRGGANIWQSPSPLPSSSCGCKASFSALEQRQGCLRSRPATSYTAASLSTQNSHRRRVDDQPVTLTPKEYGSAAAGPESGQDLLPRAMLLNTVWTGGLWGNDRRWTPTSRSREKIRPL